MKNKIVITLSWLMVLVTMIIIFSFSDQSAKKSTVVSEGVVVQILDVVMDKEDITPPVVKKFHTPIRKIAHFGVYMLLGFCMINAFDKSFKIKTYLNAILSASACALYAVTDEIHQNFSEDRGPSAIDVLIDTGGAIFGIILFISFMAIFNRIMLKKSRNC